MNSFKKIFENALLSENDMRYDLNGDADDILDLVDYADIYAGELEFSGGSIPTYVIIDKNILKRDKKLQKLLKSAQS